MLLFLHVCSAIACWFLFSKLFFLILLNIKNCQTEHGFHRHIVTIKILNVIWTWCRVIMSFLLNVGPVIFPAEHFKHHVQCVFLSTNSFLFPLFFFGFWFTLLAFHINIFEYVLLLFAITTLFRKHIVHNKKELAFITYIILYEKGKLEHKKSARTLLYNRYHFACLYSFKYLLYSMQMLNDNHWMYIWICMCVVFEMLAANKRKTQSLRLSHHRLEYSETRNILHYYIYVILFFSVFLCVFVFTTDSHHEKLCIWARTSQLHISNIYKR